MDTIEFYYIMLRLLPFDNCIVKVWNRQFSSRPVFQVLRLEFLVSGIEISVSRLHHSPTLLHSSCKAAETCRNKAARQMSLHGKVSSAHRLTRRDRVMVLCGKSC